MRKEGPLEDAIDNAKKIKIGGLGMGFKRWICGKMVKNTKILKDVEGDE